MEFIQSWLLRNFSGLFPFTLRHSTILFICKFCYRFMFDVRCIAFQWLFALFFSPSSSSSSSFIYVFICFDVILFLESKTTKINDIYRFFVSLNTHVWMWIRFVDIHHIQVNLLVVGIYTIFHFNGMNLKAWPQMLIMQM